MWRMRVSAGERVSEMVMSVKNKWPKFSIYMYGIVKRMKRQTLKGVKWQGPKGPQSSRWQCLREGMHAKIIYQTMPYLFASDN